MRISINELRKTIKTVLLRKYSSAQADLMVEVLLFGEMSGRPSHGIIRLLVGQYSIMAQNPSREPEIVRKAKVSSLILGHGNPGMLVGPLAMKEVTRLAAENGFGIVGTRENFGSSGSLSYYLEQIALQGYIGVALAQSIVSTAPHGGMTPLFGTNPISFGIPTATQPLLFDMATSAITYGSMVRAAQLGHQLPPNVALDKDGVMTTDPERAMEGATLAFDNSYKGCGLAMMVEVLAGLWPGADYAGLNISGGWGNIFMAFSPDLLLDPAEFKDKAAQLVETVRNSKTKDGGRVRIPGENTIRQRDLCLQTGEVDIDDVLFSQITTFLNTYG